MSQVDRKLVVILGATGSQGGPVARYLLKHSSHLFRVRAVTRDVTKPAALALSSLGAELVAADFSNEASLANALSGAQIIFAITNFWDQCSYSLEVTQGKLVNKLASQIPTLENYIFSGLPDGTKFEGGRFQNILPYNAKTAIKKDLQNYVELSRKTTDLWVSFYFQNWLKYPAVFGPVKDDNGTFVLAMPYPASSRFPTLWVDDAGVLVDTILKAGDIYHGKTVVMMTPISSQEEALAIWAKELGVKAVFQEVTIEEHLERCKKAGLPDEVALAAAELCAILPYEEPILTGKDIVQGSDIIPSDYKLKSWEDYVKEEEWSSLL